MKCERNRGVWLEKLEEWDLDFTKMGTFMEAAGLGLAGGRHSVFDILSLKCS